MIWKLTDKVWFGDKLSVREVADQVASVINVARIIRRPYWADLGKLPWQVWYFRLGWPDRVDVTEEYFWAFDLVLSAVGAAGKFPLLCHCKMGGHRGPTAAVVAAWYFAGRRKLEEWIGRAVDLRPGFGRPSSVRNYRDSMFRFCREVENAS